MCRLAVRSRYQNVGDALAFRARQPGRDETVRQVDQVVGVQRAPGQEHRDHRLARRRSGLQHRQVFGVAPAVGHRIGRHDVAVGLGIRRFADRRDDDVVAGRVNTLGAVAQDDVGVAELLAQAGRDAVRVREIRIRVVGTLPGQRPAAGLVGDAVGALADQQHALPLLQRQRGAVVLQQHQRLPRSATCEIAVHQRFRLAGELAGGWLVFPQACAQLDAKDAGDGVVDARLRDLARLHLRDGIGDEGLPLVGDHHHVDAGVDGLRAAVVAAAGHLADAVPVRHDETVEAHLVLQCHRQQVACAMHLAVVLAGSDVVPAVERRHDGLHAGLDGPVVALAVDVDHRGLRDRGVALVLAAVSGAIADEMLGSGDDIAVLVQHALHALDVRGGVLADQCRLRGIAFIRPAPARVLRDRDRRGKRPGHASGTRGLSRGFGDALDQFDVVRGTQADVVREDGRAVHVAVAMHGIGPPDHRHGDLRIGRHGCVVISVRQLDPILHLGPLVHRRPGAAAIEHRADVVRAHFGGRDRLDFRLHHLADLLLQRHAGQDLGHARFHGGILGEAAFQRRPVLQFRRIARCRRGGCRFGLLLVRTRHAGQKTGSEQGHSDRIHALLLGGGAQGLPTGSAPG